MYKPNNGKSTKAIQWDKECTHKKFDEILNLPFVISGVLFNEIIHRLDRIMISQQTILFNRIIQSHYF